MARVYYSKFAGRKGATLKCGKCGEPIEKGQSYRWFKVGFRSRTKYIRCYKSGCTPKQSEMTTSKMAGVYAAIEDAEANLNALLGSPEDDTSSIKSELESAAQSIRDVADEYREAADASPTGLVFGEDLNERADAVEAGADEIENWDAENEEPDFDSCESDVHDEDRDPADVSAERGDTGNCEDCAQIKTEWWDAEIESALDALTSASFE